jgi:hypothetical protein
MRLRLIFCMIVVAPILCGAGSPKVYQSKDADGNVVFSDTPSDGAEVITVAPTNSSDPVQHIPALAAPDKQVPPAPPATKLTTSPSAIEDAGEDEPEYWIGNDEDDLEGRDNGLRDRGPGPEHPLADRPRVQPLPSGVLPAAPGGAARR